MKNQTLFEGIRGGSLIEFSLVLARLLDEYDMKGGGDNFRHALVAEIRQIQSQISDHDSRWDSILSQMKFEEES